MKAEQIKADWERRCFSFGIWKDSPAQVWQDFVHDVDELFMLAEGEVRITIDGKTIEVIIGEEVFIPAGSVHMVGFSFVNFTRLIIDHTQQDRQTINHLVN